MRDPKTRAEAEACRYGAWAGDPKGNPHDPARCAKQVYSHDRAARFYQCTRKPGHGPDGLYCRKHAEQFAEAAETWWKLSSGSGRVTAEAIVSATEKRITLPGGSTEARRSQYYEWFPTKLEALRFRAERARKEHERLIAQCAAAEAAMLRFKREYEEEGRDG